MYNSHCSICKRKLLSHNLRMQCDHCLHVFHCACVMITREEHPNIITWTCPACRDSIFPFQSVDDMELLSLLLSSNDQYFPVYWCCDQMDFANKFWIHLNWMISNLHNQIIKSTPIFIILMMSIYRMFWNVIIILVSLLVNCLWRGVSWTNFLLCIIIFEVYQQIYLSLPYF